MEQAKKENKKTEEIKINGKSQQQKNGNFEDIISEVTQLLIPHAQPHAQKKEDFGKILDEITKNRFPKLQQFYNEEKQKNIDLTDSLKRSQAEFENYKKWNAKEKNEFASYAHADMISKILPVLDSFEIALKNTNEKERFIEGMKMIYAQLHSALEAQGLSHIKSEGEKFDPYRHEVLMKEDSEKPEGTILEEFQKGYMLNDKVLRFSKVKVSGK